MLEAMTEMAKNPAAGGFIGTDPRLLLTQQMAQMSGLPLTGYAQPAAQVPQLSPCPNRFRRSPAARTHGHHIRPHRRVESQIDKLVERFSNGEISEDNFNKLNARLEGKIASLRSGAG